MKTTSHLLTIGTVVRYSDSGMLHDRDAYLAQGKPSVRANYKRHYDEKMARRGTIRDIKTPTDGRAPFYVIAWENGSESQTSTHLIARA